MNRLAPVKGLGWAALIVVALLWRQYSPDVSSAPAPVDGGIAEAFANRQSGLMVEFDATVERVLRDDTEGTPHQRFIMRLDDGHTVLVAHNLDLAARVPLRESDLLRIRGEYEFNQQGGVVHWTHRDPGKGNKHGWIEHRGIRYE